MGDGSADDTIEMLKDIMYGRPKSENELAQTEKGSKAWDAMKKEVDESTGVVFIPSDDPDLSGIILEKFDWDAPKPLRKGSKCPSCKNGKLIPIVYGLPGRELVEQSGRGEIELGGCVVSSEVFNPERGLISGDSELSCPKCEGRFFRDSTRNKA
jgi:hypothetical protein